MKTPVTIFDIEEEARRKLTKLAHDYFAGGADDELTLRRNMSAYNEIILKYRVLVDVSKRDMSTTLLGQNISAPIVIAPTAFQKLSHPDGEVAIARAAGSEETIMILSTLSNCSVEEVLNVSSGSVWFQLYVFKDREVTADLIRRAETSGCKALVLTVDAPVLGRRIKDIQNNFRLPEGLSVKSLEPYMKDKFPDHKGSGIEEFFAANLDPSLTWNDIEWLKGKTKLPIFIKGIICREDALIAVANGVDGIVVSNHGGRQLDTCSATIEAFPEIADEVKGKVTLLVDGGIRKGTDILKAVAYGADAVMIGRPVVYGLAYGGEDGVRTVLRILKSELDIAMALCGCRNISEATRSLVTNRNSTQ